jgi:putative methionine-R-sulfoxide reductase with GAF domain
MRDASLVHEVGAVAAAKGPPEQRAQRIAELVRTRTGRRWVGVYRIDSDEVVNLAWSGPAAPAYPRFPADRGLTGAAIESRAPVVSNDVAQDPRYLTALDSTGSELIAPVVVEGRSSERSMSRTDERMPSTARTRRCSSSSPAR